MTRSIRTGLPMVLLAAAVTLSPSQNQVNSGIRRLVPGEYGTIQSAIDSSSDGDTVLISEGTYYENIRYRGKAITVASMFTLDGDTAHISRTIIDGSKAANPDSGSVVYFIQGEDTNSVLCGLTIQGGTGTMHHYFFPSDSVWYRLGGGIFCSGAGARIEWNVITRNRCSGAESAGGGLKAISLTEDTYTIIEHNLITNNQIRSDSLTTAWGTKGAGASVRVNARILCNLFENNSASGPRVVGGGLMFGQMSSGLFGPIPSGTICGNRFRNNSISGQISGGGGLAVDNAHDVTIRENSLYGNVSLASANADGGGASLRYSSYCFDGNRIEQNRGVSTGGVLGTGGGLDAGSPPVRGSDQVIENNIITDNTSPGGGGIGFWLNGSTGPAFVVANNTILRNRAVAQGGGYALWGGATVLSMNNIIWDNTSNGIPDQFSVQSSAFYSYNDNIKGGYAAGVGTLSTSPQFLDTSYALSDSSLCIGGGIDSVFFMGTWVHSPLTAYGGSTRPSPQNSHPDIGARESPLGVPLGVASVTIRPAIINFQNVHVGSCSDTAFASVANIGPTPRQILSVSPGRPPFKICTPLSLPIPMPALAELRLKLVFTPTDPGVMYRDTLLVTTSDPILPNISVALVGRGSGPVCSADSSIMYGITDQPDGLTLYNVSKRTGGATLIAPFTPSPPAGLTAFGVSPVDRMLYGTFSSAGNSVLYRLSSQNGDYELVRQIPIPDITSMAFGGGDILYLVTSRCTMYRMHGENGDTCFVGNTSYRFTSMTFSPATGVLWATAHDSLFTVDPVSGAPTFVGSSGWVALHPTLAFNALGTLYGLFGTRLVVFDKLGRNPTILGQTGVPDIIAIAMRSDAASVEVDQAPQQPTETRLEQNYPNPFNPKTVVSYQLSVASNVKLMVFDILGREVAVLVNEHKAPGSYSVEFDGSQFASGMYVYRLSAGSHIECRKMVLMK